MAKHVHQVCWEGEDFGYIGPVAFGDGENRAAHGCITREQRCSCGASRRVNINGWHVEYGPWGPSLEEQNRRERERAALAEAARIAVEDALLARTGWEVVGARPLRDSLGYEIDQEVALRQVGSLGGERRVLLSEIRAAAEQEDTGDGLVPVYAALLRRAQDYLRHGQ
jgi:hypothetical protein